MFRRSPVRLPRRTLRVSRCLWSRVCLYNLSPSESRTAKCIGKLAIISVRDIKRLVHCCYILCYATLNKSTQNGARVICRPPYVISALRDPIVTSPRCRPLYRQLLSGPEVKIPNLCLRCTPRMQCRSVRSFGRRQVITCIRSVSASRCRKRGRLVFSASCSTCEPLFGPLVVVGAHAKFAESPQRTSKSKMTSNCAHEPPGPKSFIGECTYLTSRSADAQDVPSRHFSGPPPVLDVETEQRAQTPPEEGLALK